MSLRIAPQEVQLVQAVPHPVAKISDTAPARATRLEYADRSVGIHALYLFVRECRALATRASDGPPIIVKIIFHPPLGKYDDPFLRACFHVAAATAAQWMVMKSARRPTSVTALARSLAAATRLCMLTQSRTVARRTMLASTAEPSSACAGHGSHHCSSTASCRDISSSKFSGLVTWLIWI